MKHAHSISQSSAELVWEAHANQVNDVCSRAWQEWPVDAAQRWVMVREGLDKAAAALEPFGILPLLDVTSLVTSLNRACQSNGEGDVWNFKQEIGAYMHLFREAIERQEGA